jgi:hypothetical protein
MQAAGPGLKKSCNPRHSFFFFQREASALAVSTRYKK